MRPLKRSRVLLSSTWLLCTLGLAPPLAVGGTIDISVPPQQDAVYCMDEVVQGAASISCDSSESYPNPDAQLAWSGDVIGGNSQQLDTLFAGQKTVSVSADGCSTATRSFSVIELEIALPPENDPFHYGASLPDRAGVYVQGTTGIPALDGALEWELEPIPGVSVDPSPAPGNGIVVNYVGLPASNSLFGTKTLTVRYPGASCSATRAFRLFFWPTDVSNPQGRDPNWYYYWSQTAANVIPEHFYSDAADCAGANGDYYGYYAPGEEYFVLCSSAPGENRGGLPCTSGHTGIDTFAETILHEGQHKRNYFDWWDPYDASKDLDGDSVPDDLEPSLGFDPTLYDTDGNGWEDEHESAYAAECRWIKGYADHEDWSVEGHQNTF